MNGLTTETADAASAAAPTEMLEQKVASRATKPRVAAPAGKATKKAAPAQKSPKTATKATPKAKAAKAAKPATEDGPRKGSKAEKILALLRHADGATLKELMKATGWQAHSVRGFLSASVGKAMRIKVLSVKEKDGERTYSIKA